MATAPEVDLLKPPRSFTKLAEFLGEVRSHHNMGGVVDVQDIWDKHDISVSDIDGFLGWLHVDRAEAPPKQLDLSKPPEKTLAKKAPEAEADPLAKAAEDEGGQEPAINIHLWNALFKNEPRRRRKEMPQATSVGLGNRAGQFAKGYNGNLLYAQLALAQADSPNGQAPTDKPYTANMTYRPNEPQPELQEEKPPALLANGLAAKAFGQKVADKAEGMHPQWNEPMRRDILPNFAAPDFAFKESKSTDQPAEPIADPLYGQVTLVAPPLQVSPENGQGAGMGLTFDWRDMAKGAGQIDYPGLVTLAKTLPEGSQVLYPAIDPRKLRGGAVNIKLDPRLAEGLVSQGYGTPGRVDTWKSARMAADWYGGTPAVSLLPATMSPLNRPGRRKTGMSADGLPQGNTVRPAEEPNRRMRFLDFLGLPIYLSPNLNTTPDLEQESRARISAEFVPRAPVISPLAFANLRSALLGGFYGVEAKPELGAWRRAAPDYERSGSSISGLLSNRLRMGAMGDGITSSRAGIPRSAALPTSVGGRFLGSPTASPPTGASMATRAPLRPSPFAPPSMSKPAIGSAAQSDVPAFIRHRPGAPASSSPSGFRPSIPAAAQAATAPMGQAATAPKGSIGAGAPIKMAPQITVAPEKTGSKVKATGAKQSQPGPARASQPAPAEGPKLSRPTAMMPQPQTPRSAAPPSTSKPKAAEPREMPHPPTAPPSSGSSLRPPQMAVAPHKPVSGPKHDEHAMAIQASPSGSGGEVSQESGNNRSAEVGEKKEAGLPGSEINLLANEVWILLKRRLAFEAQRMGR